MATFVCPQCGSSAFGTSLQNRKGHCHGSYYFYDVDQKQISAKSCGFSWDRDEDWKYFVITASTKAQFEALTKNAAELRLQTMRSMSMEEEFIRPFSYR